MIRFVSELIFHLNGATKLFNGAVCFRGRDAPDLVSVVPLPRVKAAGK